VRAPHIVVVSINGNALRIDVQGMQELWARNSTLHVPLDDVVEVRHGPERATQVLPGLSFPGAPVPYVYTAGTFHQADVGPDLLMGGRACAQRPGAWRQHRCRT
jgi:hypothetical protein